MSDESSGFDHAEASDEGFDGSGGAASVHDPLPVGGNKRRRIVILWNSPNVRTGLLICKEGKNAETAFISDDWALSRQTEPTYEARTNAIVALIHFYWEFATVSQPVMDEHALQWQQTLKRKHKTANILGFCYYRVQSIHILDNIQFDLKPYEIDNAKCQLPSWLHSLRSSSFDGIPIDLHLTHADKGNVDFSFTCSSQLCELLVKGCTNLIKVLPICQRQKTAFEKGFPTKLQSKRWVLSQPSREIVGDEDLVELMRKLYLLHLPNFIERHGFQTPIRFGKQMPDAVKSYKAVRLARNINDLRNPPTVLRDAVDLACDGDDELLDAVNDKVISDNLICRNAIQRGRLRVNIVAINLDRRRLMHLFKTQRHLVRPMHLYADGSPVTGSEIQGMVLEIQFKDGTSETWIMPGVTLHFEGLSCLDKVLAFLWSLYLLVGYEPDLMAWIISLIRSVTTDLGTELGFIDQPDVLNAFLVQVAGGDLRTAIASIDPQSRLFRRALRIGGWSHMWGNLMKMACFQIPKWPKVVALIRSCCRFMFMYVYRQCMILIPNANCF